MGWLDFLGKKDAEKAQSGADKKKVSAKPSKADDSDDSDESSGKYSAACSLCNKGGTDKKWAGQFWHARCYRNAKKMAKKMI
ncbi:MAG: hypothetical protein Q7R47_04510 [Candidatus Diapherotrites archaeon]|nr:hypothetical protein [Candidatus Diapherotrites archaeon]